jgi:hypothetical protein
MARSRRRRGCPWHIVWRFLPRVDQAIPLRHLRLERLRVENEHFAIRAELGFLRLKIQETSGRAERGVVRAGPDDLRKRAHNGSKRAKMRSSGRGFRAAPSARMRSAFNSMRWRTIFGNFLRTLATPEPIQDWSLTSLREKLIKDRRESGWPRPLHRLPDGRSCDPAPSIR